MKKSLLPFMATGVLLALGACSSDDQPVMNPDGTTITVRLPGALSTRGTFGDGQDTGDRVAVDNLQYTVFEKTDAGYTYVLDSSVANPFANGDTQTVNLNLAKGKTYNVVFYADSNADGFATYDAATGVMKVDYSKGESNNEGEDAFTGASGDITAGDAVSGTVTLYRPYAQLNWGTDDTAEEILRGFIADLTATVSVTSGLVTDYNILTNEYSGDVTDPDGVAFAPVKVVNGLSQSFPVEHPTEGKSYSLIAMNYLLTGTGTINCSLTFSHNLAPVTVNSAPVQPNYRTNIYGSLLTSPAKFNVEINRPFDGDNNLGLAPWDGSTASPVINTEASTVDIYTPAQLAGLAALVNDKNNPNDFEGYTVTLHNDYDLNGLPWTMIGAGNTRLGSATVGKRFKGVIDGNGHTIKNLAITNDAGSGSSVTAFITNLDGEGAALRNINFENVAVSSASAEQTAAAVGLLTNGAKIENVNIVSGTVSGTEATAGVVARIMKSGSVSNCSNGATISASKHNSGGIVGAAYYGAVGKTITISGCTNTGAINSQNAGAGGIVGLNIGKISDCTNSGNVTGASFSIGGIVGEQQNSGSITGCHNTGTVTSTAPGNSTYGAGGIVGWIRYSGATSSYPEKNAVTVDDCSNSAAVKGCIGVGGIAGMVYDFGTIKDCVNTAPSITASTSFAGGIAGGQQISETVPAGMDGPQMVYVTDNVSTTPVADITAVANPSLKDQYIYVNNSSCITLSGNTDVLP